MSTHSCKHVAVMACLLLMAAPALAQDAMQGMDHQSMQGMDHHAMRKHDAAQTQDAMHGMDHHATPVQDSMQGMDHGAMPTQPADASPAPRSPDYSDGIGYGSMAGMDMRDDLPLGMLLVDQLEYFDGRDDNGAAFDAQAWYGNDANKLWLKAEGELESGRLQDLRVEALWDRPVSAFWDTQLGVRHDAGEGPDRDWVAFGVQGLAPYWFEVEATVYVGPSGRTALRFESEYELLLTQRLILQPRFEVNLYGRDDPQRGVGSGLSDAALGLRLRYEFSRQFAPYLGVEFERKFGATARLARDAGDSAFDARVVAGLRFWF